MKTELTLVRITPAERRERRSAPPRAWWIPGNSAAAWIAVIEELDLAAAPHDLFPISRHDRKDGAILIAAGPSDRHTRSAVPLHEFLPTIWIPADARPAVSVGDSDTASWRVADYAVFFPDNTLLHLDRARAIQLPDLIAPPVPNSRQWIATATADTFVPCLRSITSYHAPSFEEIIEEAKDNIGSKDPKELGPKSSLGKLGRGLRNAGKMGLAGPPALLLGGLLKLYNALPGSAASPTALDRLAHWAATKIEDLRKRQNSEMNRLRKLFEEDPDKALEHAIPLGGGNDSRGIGGPSTTLGWNKVDFSLSQLGGGGPSSPWEIDAETWADLTRRYREAANREINLGRHRRAAYIFAHLLNDLPAAAEALKSGGFYREAAAIYEKLKRPLDTADCHVLAGDIEKAAAIYRDIPDLPALAKLYRKLNRPEDEEKTWREEIDRLKNIHDFHRAAWLLHEELKQTDEAINLLASLWPSPANLDIYLPYELKLRRLHHSPESYHDRLIDLLDTLPLPLASDFAQVLLGETSRHPADERTPWIADTIRLAASRVLTSAHAKDRADILSTLASLDPGDHIHASDARRFKRLTQPDPTRAIQLPLRLGRAIDFKQAKLVRQFPFPTPLSTLLDIGYCRDGFVAIGADHASLVSLRHRQTGAPQMHYWTGVEPDIDTRVSIRETPDATIALVTTCFNPESRRIPRIDSAVDDASFAVNGLSDPTAVGGCIADNGSWICRLLEGTGFILDHCGPDGETRTYHLANTPPELDQDLVANKGLSVLMTAFSRQVYLAFGSALARFENGRFTWMQFPENILRIRKSPAHTKERVLLLTKSRLITGPVDLDLDSLTSTEIDSPSDSCFLHNGFLATVRPPELLELRDPVSSDALANPTILELNRRYPFLTRIVRLPNRNGFTLVHKSEIHEYDLT